MMPFLISPGQVVGSSSQPCMVPFWKERQFVVPVGATVTVWTPAAAVETVVHVVIVAGEGVVRTVLVYVSS